MLPWRQVNITSGSRRTFQASRNQPVNPTGRLQAAEEWFHSGVFPRWNVMLQRVRFGMQSEGHLPGNAGAGMLVLMSWCGCLRWLGFPSVSCRIPQNHDEWNPPQQIVGQDR